MLWNPTSDKKEHSISTHAVKLDFTEKSVKWCLDSCTQISEEFCRLNEFKLDLAFENLYANVSSSPILMVQAGNDNN